MLLPAVWRQHPIILAEQFHAMSMYLNAHLLNIIIQA